MVSHSHEEPTLVAASPSVNEGDPRELGLAIEIMPATPTSGGLYFASIGNHPTSTPQRKFFTIDFDLVYDPYFADFGPLHLGHLTRFCRAMKRHLQGAAASPELAGASPTTQQPQGSAAASVATPEIVFYTSHQGHKRANAGYLIACFCVCVLGMTPTEAWALFETAYPPFLPFRDASYGVSTFNLTVFDCMCGLYRAMRIGWYSVDAFDLEEYDTFEKVENGDFNWIVPRKFIACSSPIDDSGPALAPERLIRPFRERGVSLVVRLNEHLYDRHVFQEVGIRHADLPFEDGATPSDAVATAFLAMCEAQHGTVAVHCKAGLGRTGTVIGLYCLKHFGFTAKEYIAWARMCRPGSVVGVQQHYLEKIEKRFARAFEIGTLRVVGSAAKPTSAPASAPSSRGSSAAPRRASVVASLPTTAATTSSGATKKQGIAGAHKRATSVVAPGPATTAPSLAPLAGPSALGPRGDPPPTPGQRRHAQEAAVEALFAGSGGAGGAGTAAASALRFESSRALFTASQKKRRLADAWEQSDSFHGPFSPSKTLGAASSAAATPPPLSSVAVASRPASTTPPPWPRQVFGPSATNAPTGGLPVGRYRRPGPAGVGTPAEVVGRDLLPPPRSTAALRVGSPALLDAPRETIGSKGNGGLGSTAVSTAWGPSPRQPTRLLASVFTSLRSLY